MTTISLNKGNNISLSKASAGLTQAIAGLGWDPRSTTGQAFDLDAFAIGVKADRNVREASDFVYFGNLSGVAGSVVHQGDNLTGDGDGDDEQIKVDLPNIPAEIETVVFVVNIHEASERNQSFGDVRNAYIRVLDGGTNEEIVKYDLGEDYSTETALIFGELYRHNGEWKFRAVGQGYAGGITEILSEFGINIG